MHGDKYTYENANNKYLHEAEDYTRKRKHGNECRCGIHHGNVPKRNFVTRKISSRKTLASFGFSSRKSQGDIFFSDSINFFLIMYFF